MFPLKNERTFNNNNIYQLNNNDNLNTNKINTNRLINESLSLNSKVEQYRQALSMASININKGSYLNDNINNYNNSMHQKTKIKIIIVYFNQNII